MKPRPIKVTLPSNQEKMKILKSANQLKGHRLYSKVGLSTDKTKKEREAHNELRKELAERRNNKEDVIIYKDQVMLRSEKSQMVQDRQAGMNRSSTGAGGQQ